MERKLIAAAVASAVALPMAAQAVEFSVSGHINRAILSVDGGGNDGDLQHVDADSSQTRFRIKGSEELENGMTAGVNLEYGASGAPNLRHAAISLSTAGGNISIGHTSTATDGMAHARLGGPSWLGGVTNWCSYHSAGLACLTHDGGRSPIVKYDAPALGPVSFSTSVGNDEYWDVMVKIAGSFGDAGYDLRIGHITEYDKDVAAVEASNTTINGPDVKTDDGDPVTVDSDLPDDVTRLGGDDDSFTVGDIFNKYTPGTAAGTKDVGDITAASAAVSFGQGTSIAVSWGGGNSDDSEHQYVELDHSYGDGSIGVYYRTGEKGDADGSLWGIGIGHSLGGGATAYAGYRRHSEDGMDDTDVLLAGMHVTFN